MATRVRKDRHDFVDSLQRREWSVVARMPGLAARLAATPRPAASRPGPARQAIGRRRLRRGRRVLVVQRELALEVGDPLRLLDVLASELLVLAAEPLQLSRMIGTGRRRRLPRRSLFRIRPMCPPRLHAAKGTESSDKVQGGRELLLSPIRQVVQRCLQKEADAEAPPRGRSAFGDGGRVRNNWFTTSRRGGASILAAAYTLGHRGSVGDGGSQCDRVEAEASASCRADRVQHFLTAGVAPSSPW